MKANLQNPRDPLSYLAAWLALVPQALCVVYVSVIWASREVEVLLMFAGQMGCEALNFGLKRWIREERPKRTCGINHHHGYLFSFPVPAFPPLPSAGRLMAHQTGE